MDEYVKIKDMFISVCSTKGSPTLEEVKDRCIDLIQCKHIPRITRQEDDIEKARTFTELARIVCFQLSKWVSYEFFKKVVTHFQPALKRVKQRLMRYENKLKPLLLQKLEHIAEKQRRWVIGTMENHDVYYFTLVRLCVYLYLSVSFCSCVCFCILNCFSSYCVCVFLSCIPALQCYPHTMARVVLNWRH